MYKLIKSFIVLMFALFITSCNTSQDNGREINIVGSWQWINAPYTFQINNNGTIDTIKYENILFTFTENRYSIENNNTPNLFSRIPPLGSYTFTDGVVEFIPEPTSPFLSGLKYFWKEISMSNDTLLVKETISNFDGTETSVSKKLLRK